MIVLARMARSSSSFPFPSHGTGASQSTSHQVDPAASIVVTIGSSQVAVLKSRGPVDIRCLSGLLWITTDGDIRDTILSAGQRHCLTHAARGVLLSAAASGEPVTVDIAPLPEKRGWLSQRLRPELQLEIA